ncbi:MAG: DUF6048 family protein [Chryseolinea sp.]
MASAQKADTVREKHSYKPTGIRIGTDVLSIVRSSTDDTFEGWEVNADVDFYRYYLAMDYGYWARDYEAETGQYHNNGTYWRLGGDVNFLTKDPDRNMFFIGFRYGRSQFSESLVVERIDPNWGSLNATYTNSNISAGWLELTTGLRVKLWKFIWMGYTARLKFAPDIERTPEMEPHDVPGYGRADKDYYWGFNYQILIRLPLRKTPSVLLEK